MPQPDSRQSQGSNTLVWEERRWVRPVLRIVLLTIYCCALVLPLYVFFHDRGGFAFLHGASGRAYFQLLFPLLGFYAFTFVTWQVLLASNLYWLKNLWPRAIYFHRFQGSFALLFALLHPLFILAGVGLSNDLHLRFVTNAQKWWLLPAYTALTILLLTVITAWLAWQGLKIPWWRKLHRLNYLVFALVWVHSWFIGSDVRSSPLLRWVWPLYAAAACISIAGNYAPKFLHHKRAIDGTPKARRTNYVRSHA